MCPRPSSVLIQLYVCRQVVEEELGLDYTPHVVVTSTLKDVASTAEKLGLRPGTPLSLQALSLSLRWRSWAAAQVLHANAAHMGGCGADGRMWRPHGHMRLSPPATV